MRHEITVPQRIAAGVAGSAALLALNEVAHRVASESPRIDVLGMRALVKGVRTIDGEPPRGAKFRWLSALTDLVRYSVLFAATLGRRQDRTLVRGVMTGLGVGVAAAAVGSRLGLDESEGYHLPRRLSMIGMYALGGLAAALAARLVSR